MKKIGTILLYVSLILGVLAILLKGIWLFLLWPLSLIAWTLVMAINNRGTKGYYLWIVFLLVTLFVFGYGLTRWSDGANL